MKTFHTLLITLFISASVFAQRPDREKIKALKIAHITEQMDLSKKEAQKFWPIYNANEDAEDQLREKFSALRNEKSANELTESEAKTYLLNLISIEQEKTELRAKLLNDLLEILPAKKIVALVQAEKSFRRKMIEEYKERHRKMKQN
ncbi:sensor of ECF-type sigma factor [Winogradskyella forsetii]|uniref:sensor of ECF-type sigma factor n=1 Tax=Winogradskyella forsetii TaxID=2686077 RepID=UPI0015BB89D5|nr:sensor of ECF-type sigma factor [Winogradskyella forsetii]